jgi:solute:Na+ symporter, SSS family
MKLTLAYTDWIVFIIMLSGSLILGLFLSAKFRSGESSSNFFLAGRKLTWPFIGASLFATNIGAEHLVGLSGDSYRYGLCAGTVELTTIFCLGFASAFLFPYYIKNRVFTIPEFLEMRYNSAARTFFSALMLVVCIMTKMAFTLYAGALVLNSLLGWNIMSVVFILAVITATITIIGGFAAVAFTDTIQTFIMILGGVLTLFIGLHMVGGWDELVRRVPEAMNIAHPYDDPNYPFIGALAGGIYGGIFYWGIDQVNVQRVLGAPDLKHARWGAMFAALLKLTPVFIFALPGVIALALFPGLQGDDTRQVFVVLLDKLLPAGIRGLVLAALLAAIISSLDGVMNSVSTMVVRDFVLKHRPQTSERSQVWIGRFAIIISAVLGVGAAILVWKTPGGLYKYLQTISIYLVMPVAPAIVFGILSRKVTMKAAVISVLAGVFLAVLFVTDQLMGPETATKLFPFLHHKLTANFYYRGLWGTIIIIGVLFAVSFVTEKTPAEKLEKTTVRWEKHREPFTGLKDWRLQFFVLLLVTFVLYAWLW